jgi:AhpD family alkylhydroperoxidase
METMTGFEFALQPYPAALRACREMSESLEQGELSARERALIAIAVAQQGGCDYCLWVHTRRGTAAGLTGEDVAFASMGTAIDRRESALVALACVMANTQSLAGWCDLTPSQATLLTPGDIVEVSANVAANVLINATIHSVAPRAGISTGARRAA